MLARLFAEIILYDSVPGLTLEFQNDNPAMPATATLVLKGQRDALPRWEQTLSLASKRVGNEEAGDQPPQSYASLDDVAKVQESVRESFFGPPQKYTSVDEVLKAFKAGELVDVVEVGNIIDRIQAEERFSGHYYDSEATLEWIIEAVSQLLVGPGQLVRDALTGFRYLGPLRETPSRDHAPPRFPDPSRWASGLGAWDRLASGEEEFVDVVSHWLGDRERLNAGYNVRCKRFKELDLSDPLAGQLLTGKALADADSVRLGLERLPTRSRIQILPSTVDGHVSQDPVELQPQDVGVGISQVVPVVVTALDGKGRLLAIEQPELHLHPRLQAELGDLFIQAAKGETAHTLLLETHSEMIPLRIMRRIRNTVEGSLPSHVPPITSADVAIYYVALHDSTTVVCELELDERGQLLDPWPEGFFEEGFRERFGK